jgi:small-conductance mechanosensitive channel
MTDGIVMSIWSSISDALYWTPDWVPGTLVLAIAVIAALVAHRIVFRLLTRFGERNPFVRRVVTRVKGPSALALVAFALGAALQSAPFDPAVSASFGRLLLIAFIVLAGWIAHIAAETGGSLYLRRFTVESVDDLLARKHVTQVRILKRAVNTLIVVVTLSAVLMTFEPVRQYGVSLFASAGVAGLVVGLAARPMLSNLIAGIQIATTQPIRIDDQVIVENESGRIEEITSTYVVIRLWDLRRLIVPLSHFIEKPFQNWTRETTNLIGSVFLYVDFTAPVEVIRGKLLEIVQASRLWDGEVAKLQVTDAKESGIELRALASARTAGDAFDLRCEIREQLIGFLRTEYPNALPRARQETMRPDRPDAGGAAQQDGLGGRPAPTAAG